MTRRDEPEIPESEFPTAASAGSSGGTPSQYPTADRDSPDAVPAPLPLTIGPYTLREKLGEGGFGEVYVAEQSEPVRRRVALKMLKAGMDTKAVLSRFEAERQALARMDHPHIATVLDAGMTDQGRSYFVMEMVDGEPITSYCDRHRLGIRDRLDLFIAVCNGVQHAHQKGIIHRDLKPSNILVTTVDDRAMPKVIDFGIAKATSAAQAPEAIHTLQGELIGTPEYMSPEQAEMGDLDVDTRTDIYSLGVVLYELLSGALPFDSRTLRRGGVAELRRIIREVEPARPSTRLSTSGKDPSVVARMRGTEIRLLARTLKDELDWIVLKAMEKDRARRYESASALAQEIRRYLNHEPLVAGPPGAAYRIGKLVQRHRAAFVGGSLMGLALLAGVAGLAFGLVRARRAEQTAFREAATTKKVLDFMVGMFRVSDPSEARGNSITAREILDKGAVEIGQGLEAEPLVQARLMTTMGDVYKELGLYGPARSLLEKSLAIREKWLAPDDLLIAANLNSLAIVRNDVGDYAGARRDHERALAMKEKALGPDHPDVAVTLNNLAIVRHATGDYAESQRLHERALAIREKHYGPDHPDVADSESNLAAVLQQSGNNAEARRLFERALAIREKAFGPDHRLVADCLSNLAAVCWTTGDYATARSLWERSLRIVERTLGPDHPDVATGAGNLGAALYSLEDYAGAKPLFERAVAIREKTLGPDHPLVAAGLLNVAGVMQATGDLAGATSLCERALGILEKSLGPDHAQVGAAVNNLGSLYRQSGDLARSRLFLDRAQAIWETSLGPDHPVLADNLEEQAALFRQTGDVARAEAMATRARAIREKNKASVTAG